jgi:hypothetical protein
MITTLATTASVTNQQVVITTNFIPTIENCITTNTLFSIIIPVNNALQVKIGAIGTAIGSMTTGALSDVAAMYSAQTYNISFTINTLKATGTATAAATSLHGVFRTASNSGSTFTGGSTTIYYDGSVTGDCVVSKAQAACTSTHELLFNLTLNDGSLTCSYTIPTLMNAGQSVTISDSTLATSGVCTASGTTVTKVEADMAKIMDTLYTTSSITSGTLNFYLNIS